MKKIAHFLRANAARWKKTLLVMKIACLLLLIALHVSARNYGQETISLQFKKGSLFQVFKTIEKQTSYRFYFSDDVVPANKQVSISIKDASLNEVMDIVLGGSKLAWRMLDNKLVVISAFEKQGYLLKDTTLAGNIRNEK